MTRLDTFTNSHDTARNRDLALPNRSLAMPSVFDLVPDEVAALGGPTTTDGRIEASLAPNTRRVLERVAREFTGWCEANGRSAMPADGRTLADYVNARCNAGRRDAMGRPRDGLISPDALRQQLFAVRRLHRAAGYRDHPDTEDALAVIKTHERLWAADGNRSGHAAPLNVTHLKRCLRHIDDATYVGVRNRALLIVGTAAFLRRSELADLRRSDLEIHDHGVTVHVRVSKTGIGQAVHVVRGEHDETCPRRALLELDRALRLERNRHTDHVLYRRDRWGNLPGPLTGQSVGNVVKTAAVAAQLDEPDRFSGHSLRAGGATTAYMAHLPIESIRRHGRWSPNSTSMYRYFRAVDDWRNNVSGGLGL